MAEKIACEICGKICKDIDGLLKHKQAKHNFQEKEESSKDKINISKGWIISSFLLIILIAVFYFIFKSVPSCSTDPINEINIGGHTNLALHIHADLEILIDGNKEFIPANIGVSQNVMRPIHTHDSSGEVHIEGPCKREWTLGEFFEVWNKEFSSQRIFEKTIENGELTMTVNGIPNTDFENYILKDGDKIVIEYKEN